MHASGSGCAARSLLCAAHQLRLVFGKVAAKVWSARVVGVDGHCAHLLLEAALPVNSAVHNRQLLSGLDGPRRPHIRSLCEVRRTRVECDAAFDDHMHPA